MASTPSSSLSSSTLGADISMEESLTAYSKPLTEFKPFQRLPIELRLMIWNFAAPDSDIITQRGNEGTEAEDWADENKEDHGLVRDPEDEISHDWNRLGGIPAILHACRESRRHFSDTGYSSTRVNMRLGNQNLQPIAYAFSHQIKAKTKEEEPTSLSISTQSILISLDLIATQLRSIKMSNISSHIFPKTRTER